MNTFRITLLGSLAISLASFVYLYLAPESFHPIVIFGAPLAVLILVLCGKLAHTRQHTPGTSNQA